MELPIKPNSNLSFSIQNFFKPFIQTHTTKKEQLIMPLSQVEKKLHEHYVSLEPIDILFEYYDEHHHIQQETIQVKVVSTVQADRRIAVSDIHSNRSFILSLEQILSVSANAA
ncbi:hypothetical protein ACF3NG_06285 [Aerococcaceae bacterium WGS1372]